MDVVSPFCKPYHMATASPCWFSINVQIKTCIYVRVIICLRPVTSVTSQVFFDKKKTFEQGNGLFAAPRIFGGGPSGTSDLELLDNYWRMTSFPFRDLGSWHQLKCSISPLSPTISLMLLLHPWSLSSSSRIKPRDLLQAMERALTSDRGGDLTSARRRFDRLHHVAGTCDPYFTDGARPPWIDLQLGTFDLLLLLRLLFFFFFFFFLLLLYIIPSFSRTLATYFTVSPLLEPQALPRSSAGQ